jgi:hypothetical protein
VNQLQTVLDALEIAEKHLAYVEITEAIAIIHQMMQAEPVLEVVRMPDHWDGPYFRDDGGSYISESAISKLPIGTKLYTAPQAKKCKYGDPLCPCQDGHQCHYEGTDAWTAPQAVPAGWLPIESAPKPSGRVLLAAEGQTCYGHWYSLAEPPRWEYDGYACGNPKTQPTHWMKLPSPPKETPCK